MDIWRIGIVRHPKRVVNNDYTPDGLGVDTENSPEKTKTEFR
jgi:hypothetical protein